MLPPMYVARLTGRIATLCRGASIRRIGGDGNEELAAFKGDENVTFPFRPGPEENWVLQALLHDGRIAGVTAANASNIARLALDGVIAVEHESGSLTGGACAAYLLEPPGPRSPDSRHVHVLAGRLLRTLDARLLAHGLYTSGRWPVSPPSLAAARRLLAALQATHCPAAWVRAPLDTSSAWLAWRRRVAFAGNPTGLPRVKMYVSVDPEFLESRWRAMLDLIFASPETHEVKTAATMPGLHRADAFVVYSETHGHLPALARALTRLLVDAPPSGMTFAASFPEAPNIFWGMDPLLPEHLVYGESWRRFLCNRCARLAVGLWEAGILDPLSAARAALFRLNLDGIDTDHWIPPYASQTA